MSPYLSRLTAICSVVALIFIVSCGGDILSIDQPQNMTEGSANPSVDITLPDGYSYDGKTDRLTKDGGGKTEKSAPSYITDITLTITGEGLEPLKIPVPLDTLHVRTTITVGIRTFSVLIKTTMGATFTGSTTANVTPGFAGPITIELEVNAPPIINAVVISNPNPQAGETITITADITEHDSDDILKYLWKLAGQGIRESHTTSVPTFTEKAPPISGKYTLTLVVTDNHGGRTEHSATIFVTGGINIIGITFSATTPALGDTVTANVVLSQLSPYISPEYYWNVFSPLGTHTMSSGSPFVSFTISESGTYHVDVEVEDQFGYRAEANSTIGLCSTPAVPTGVASVASASVNGGADVTWNAVTGADFYNVHVYNTTPVLQQTVGGIQTLSAVPVEPVTQMRKFSVSAGTVCGANSAESALTTAIAMPGVVQPTNLGESGSATNSTVLYWTPQSGANSFTLYWANTTTPANGTYGGATYEATCASTGSAPWTGTPCMTFTHSCTSGDSYDYEVTESNGTYTSEKSTAFTMACM